MSSATILDVTQDAETKVSKSTEVWTIAGQTSLTEDDKNILTAGMWLNDRHIHAAQELLKGKHAISGFSKKHIAVYENNLKSKTQNHLYNF